MTITPLPTPPNSVSRPTSFNSDADTFLAALPTLVSEINALIVTSSTIGRNLIINGGMAIDQRHAGTSFTPTTSAYAIDRWYCGLNVASKFSIEQNSSSPPVGFDYYLEATSLSAYTVGAGEYFNLQQPIEGINTIRLSWGTVDAKAVSLSFYAKSSLTGNFSGALRNAANDRSYPFSYNIPVANVWTLIKVENIPGDITGTWQKGSLTGILLDFSYGTGTTYSSTADSWQAGNFVAVTGAVKLVATNAATLKITAVQLEEGPTASPYEHRLFNDELSACYRYYQRLTWVAAEYAAQLQASSSTTAAGKFCNFLPMRVSPIVASSGLFVGFDNTFSGNNNVTVDILQAFSNGSSGNIFMACTISSGTPWSAGGVATIGGGIGGGVITLDAEL